jgi:hypothetical protein
MSALLMGLLRMPAPHVSVFLLRFLMYRFRMKKAKMARMTTAPATMIPANVPVERPFDARAWFDSDTWGLPVELGSKVLEGVEGRVVDVVVVMVDKAPSAGGGAWSFGGDAAALVGCTGAAVVGGDELTILVGASTPG